MKSQVSKSQPAERRIITDKLVIEKTGESMEHWFTKLDKAGALKMKPTEIYQTLVAMRGAEDLGEWNCGLLSTTYQWSRKMRERGEKENGFEISVSKTVNVPVAILYEAFANEKKRNSWLGEDALEVTKSTRDKSLRALWNDRKTRVSVDFYSKSAAKSQVVLQHLKIQDSKSAANLKVIWANHMEDLDRMLNR